MSATPQSLNAPQNTPLSLNPEGEDSLTQTACYLPSLTLGHLPALTREGSHQDEEEARDHHLGEML